MRLGIHGKLALSSAVLVLVMSALTGWLLVHLTREAMGRQRATDLAEETRLKGQELLAALALVHFDASFQATRREVVGVLRPDPPAGADPEVTRREYANLLSTQTCPRWFKRRRADGLNYLSFLVLDERQTVLFEYHEGQGGNRPPDDFLHSLDALLHDRGTPSPSRPTAVFSAITCRGGDPPVLELWAAAPIRQGGHTGALLIGIDLGPRLQILDRSARHWVVLSDEAGRLLLHPDPGLRPTTGHFHTLTEAPLLGPSTDRLIAPVHVGTPPQEPRMVRHEAATGLTGRSEPQWFLTFDNLSDDDLQKVKEHEAELLKNHPRVIFDPIDPAARHLSLRSRGPNRGALEKAAQAIRAMLPTRTGTTPTALRTEAPVECRHWTFSGVSLLLPTAAAAPHRLDLTLGVAAEQVDLALDRAFATTRWAIVALGGIAALLAVGLAHVITRQLNRLIWATEKAARGEPMNLTWQVKSQDELGVLARSFQHMLTEQRKRELAVKENEARLSTILDNANEGILTLDEKGNIETFNRAAEALFGYLQAEVRGQNYRVLVQGRSKKDPSELFVSTLLAPTESAAGVPSLESSLSMDQVTGYTKIVTGQRQDGTHFPVEISVREVPFGDRPIFTAIVRDITDRLRYEEELERRVKERTAELEHANEQLSAARNLALEAVRTKDSFLANMSHELRTPLNAIIGYCEFLQEDTDAFNKDEALRDLAKIEKAGKHLLTIINDILDLAKVASGKLKLELTDFPVEPLLNELAEMLGPLVRNRGNLLTVQPAADLGAMRADRIRVRQVLLNLLSNANKFTDRGSILLKATRESTPAGDQIVLRVTDTGKGMSAEEVKKLFQPFFQADSSSTRKHEGTGLGLAISQRFCNMMGGDVDVTSRSGEGSTFTVRLPATVVLEPGSGSVYQARPPVGAVREADDSVLVIDDDPSVRELMERFLGKEGYTVRTASSGEEGLKLVKQLKPRAITLDAMMPGIDGWAVLAALKSDPATADIPIIMATIVDDQTRGFTLGATDYLTKPIDWGRLAHILHSLGANRSAGPVLVVEDDAASRELVHKMLAKEGWDVMEAANGREGLTAARQRRPTLVLLDLMMPEVDGFQFVEELRQDPDLHGLPVVVVTARELTEEDRRRLNGSVLQVIRKGHFSPEQLLDEVRRFLPGERGASAP